MITNFQKKQYFLNTKPSDNTPNKIYLVNPNAVDASTSWLEIPDTFEFRHTDSFQDTKRHIKHSFLVGLSTVPILLSGGYLFAIKAAEKKFFVDAAKKSNSRFRPIIDDLKGKISKVTITTSDKVKLKCWDINPNGSEKYVLVCHGNSQNLNECQEIYNILHKKGYGVLALEYRGYAKNPGTVSENGLYKDGEAALKYLKDKGIKSEKIAVLGYSLGGAVAVDIASKNKLGGVILMSTFTNAKELSKNAVNYLDLNLPQKIKKTIDAVPDTLIPLSNSYRSDKKIAEVSCPITFIHSRDDSAIPLAHAKKLEKLAKKSPNKTFITLPSGSHWFDDQKFRAVSEAMDKLSL